MTRRGASTRRRFFVGLGICLVLLTPSAVLAATSNFDGWARTSAFDCQYLHASISTAARPHTDSFAAIDWNHQGNWCNNITYSAEPWRLKVIQDLLRWNGSSWEVCDFGPEVFNSDWAHAVQTGFDWQSPPCPGGSYYLMSGSFWSPNGVNWNGGFKSTNWINVF